MPVYESPSYGPICGGYSALSRLKASLVLAAPELESTQCSAGSPAHGLELTVSLVFLFLSVSCKPLTGQHGREHQRLFRGHIRHASILGRKCPRVCFDIHKQVSDLLTTGSESGSLRCVPQMKNKGKTALTCAVYWVTKIWKSSTQTAQRQSKPLRMQPM